MIVTFTDFGVGGPYVGQMLGVLAREAPGIERVDLMRDAPNFDPRASAYLLAALAHEFPEGTVFLCVIDPGVGGRRRPLVVRADGHWFVGAGNGLFEIVARRASSSEWWEILWRPERLSASFHGRDLFAPVAARIARGETLSAPWAGHLPDTAERRPDWPDDLPAVIYVDGYGNVVTGLRWESSGISAGSAAGVEAGGRIVRPARTFSDVPEGEPFCYENSNGLLEIAVNRGRADVTLGLGIGSQVSVREACA